VGALTEHLDKETATIITDGKSAYRNILPPEKHIEGNHKEELKTRKYVSTFTVENAFSLFKRGIVGSYHKLSEDHLDRYLGEFCWRYNRRDKQPIMFELRLTNLVNKKPLPYKTLIYDGFRIAFRAYFLAIRFSTKTRISAPRLDGLSSITPSARRPAIPGSCIHLITL
jgi:hypothetical protein